MVLFAQRRLVVANEPEHNLGVDETQRVHDANRRARGAVRVPAREPQLEVIPSLVPQLILCGHTMRHDRCEQKTPSN